jgi:MinD-like ATPase involved in chromosome partitioning or flagellar assembly/CheY-like chemotaxis protein
MSDEQFKILVIEDNPGDVRLLREELAETTNSVFELVEASSLTAATRLLSQQRFDCVLLDLNLPDGSGTRNIEKLRSLAPQIPVVVLTGQDDETTGIRAMQAGAEDYLVKGWAFCGGALDWRHAFKQGSYDYLVKGQMNKNYLSRTIKYAIQRRRSKVAAVNATERTIVPLPSQRANVLAFVGAKGGVGTTTVALNVAAALARQGRTVAALEVQPVFGTFSAYLNFRPAESLADLIEMDADKLDPQIVRQRTARLPSGVTALFASRPPIGGRELTGPHLDAILSALSAQSDHVVVDLVAQPSSLARAALRHLASLTIVTGPERASVVAAGHAAELIGTYGPLPKLGFVVVNTQGAVDYQALVELEARTGHGVLACVPPAGDALRTCQKSGLPLVLASAKCPAASVLTDLAQKLIPEAVMAAATA